MNVIPTDQNKDRFEEASRSEWVHPALVRFAAGSAEDGFNPNPDGAQDS